MFRTGLSFRRARYKNNLKKINKLKRELVNLGYKSHEVKSIILTAGGGNAFRTLNEEQLIVIANVLEKQLLITKEYFS